MQPSFAPRVLGSTQLPVGPLGLGSSFGLPAAGVERAFERGVSFFLYGSIRRASFGVGLKNLARTHRSDMVIAIQTYTRAAWMMRYGVDRARKQLNTDYVDVLTLSWWNAPPPARIVDAALELKARGKVRHLMLSSHHRPSFEAAIDGDTFDALMVRYNAAHPGAEREVFPHLARRRPGIVSFTATRWGTLLKPELAPRGEATPRASDCYRFGLTNPNVDVSLAGPKDDAQLDEALVALEKGPMSDDELAWMRRVGSHVRAETSKGARVSPMDLVDRATRLFRCAPKALPSP